MVWNKTDSCYFFPKSIKIMFYVCEPPNASSRSWWALSHMVCCHHVRRLPMMKSLNPRDCRLFSFEAFFFWEILHTFGQISRKIAKAKDKFYLVYSEYSIWHNIINIMCLIRSIWFKKLSSPLPELNEVTSLDSFQMEAVEDKMNIKYLYINIYEIHPGCDIHTVSKQQISLHLHIFTLQ